MSQSGSVLDKIVETKRAEIAAAKQRVSEESLRERLADAPGDARAGEQVRGGRPRAIHRRIGSFCARHFH